MSYYYLPLGKLGRNEGVIRLKKNDLPLDTVQTRRIGAEMRAKLDKKLGLTVSESVNR